MSAASSPPSRSSVPMPRCSPSTWLPVVNTQMPFFLYSWTTGIRALESIGYMITPSMPWLM